MEKFIELCEQFSFTQFVTLIVLLTLGIKGASDVIKGIKTYLNDWYSKKRGIEKKDETIEQRVTKLEERDEEQLERLDTISAGVQQIAAVVDTMAADIKEQLHRISEENSKTAVAQARASLHRLAREFEERDHLTTAEYETFSDLAAIYIKNGGNCVFQNKIIPHIESLPIRD